MSNPYISKQTLLEQRAEIERTLTQNFSNRVQDTIKEALETLSNNLQDNVEIKIDLSMERLSYNIYSSILGEHCGLLEDLDYITHISHINLNEGYAIIRLSLYED